MQKFVILGTTRTDINYNPNCFHSLAIEPISEECGIPETILKVDESVT